MSAQPISQPTMSVLPGGSASVRRECVRDLFMLGVLGKLHYIALCLRMEQPKEGVFRVDVYEFAEEISFEACPAGKDKEKSYEITPEDVQSALFSLEKKGALQADREVQLNIGLMY